MIVAERPHLSHSQIETLERCGMQYYHRYVMGRKEPPGVAQLVGKSVHSGAEADLTRKMQWGTLLDRQEMEATTADALGRMWDEHPPEIKDGDPSNRGKAIDIAVELARVYHDQLAPKLEPVAIEQSFRIDLPSLPFDIVGVVDCETATHVRDLKTKKRLPQQAAVDRSSQLALYHLHAAINGAPDKTVAFDCLIKTQHPYLKTMEATPGPADHVALVRRVELASQSITSGIFRPASPDSWACSAKFCGYYAHCEFGDRKSVSVGLIDPRNLTSRLIPRPGSEDTEPDGDSP